MVYYRRNFFDDKFMLNIDFQNIFNVGKEGISEAEFNASAKFLPAYLAKLKTRGQGFYDVVDDQRAVASIEKFAKSRRGEYSSIVVLGIGGSALGIICLYQSLKHLFQNELKALKWPKLYVLDNIDPTLIKEVLDVVDLKKTLFVVVTKSGGTPETLSQYFYFRNLTEKKKLDVKKSFVFVTDAKAGLLRKISNEEKIPAFDVPANVGGRFSVLTAVGLLPAALVGINIKELLRGAREMRNSFLNESFENNLSFRLSAAQYLLSKKGKSINALMPYAQKLIKFADWYRQLLAESIGKATNRDGATVNVGITPVSALGVTDQHSQSQLYNEGPNDKLIMFVAVNKLAKDLAIPNLFPADSSVGFLNKATFNRLMDVERRGTADALTQNSRPNLTIGIDAVDEFYLGAMFMLFEGSVAFLGEWFDINAFDQPGVELSKQLTKKLLS